MSTTTGSSGLRKRRVEPRSAPLRFTLSISPALGRGGWAFLRSEEIVERLRRNAERIEDINFSCRLPPFERDAHGVLLTSDEAEAHMRDALWLQERSGIAFSAVCNNVHTPNDAATLRTFADALDGPYARGLRSVTVPHLLWLKMGVLQRRFPDLRIKNTVLRRVRTGQDFINHAEAGFHYVNIDRVVVRDRAALEEIYRAQQHYRARTGRHVVTAVLDGEGCLGACPLWEEHYQHTLTHPNGNTDPQTNLEIFRWPQSFSCALVGEPGINELMAVGLPPFRADFDEVCALFDVIKLAGRRSIHSLDDGLRTVEGFGALPEGLLPGAPEPLARLTSAGPEQAALLERWRRTTRTCRFQCWSCSACTEIAVRAAELPPGAE